MSENSRVDARRGYTSILIIFSAGFFSSRLLPRFVTSGFDCLVVGEA